jgi:hypothetical protein
MMEEITMTVACFENECDAFGYAVLLCKYNEWRCSTIPINKLKQARMQQLQEDKQIIR